MKVKDVIATLQKLDSELDVFVSRDEEGNGFNRLYSVEENLLDAEGEVVATVDICEHESEDDCSKLDACEWKRRNTLRKVVMLWP